MLGRIFIENLLPHRPPFLMVESIVDYVGGDAPILKAERPIRNSEPVFSEITPPFYLPSVYIVEGLGQCCNLLSIIWSIEQIFVAKGNTVENFDQELMNMVTNNDDKASDHKLEFFKEDITKSFSRIGLLAFVDVKIIGKVIAGELLSYKIQQVKTHGELSHFAVSANVGGQTVAQGTLVGSEGARMEGTVL